MLLFFLGGRGWGWEVRALQKGKKRDKSEFKIKLAKIIVITILIKNVPLKYYTVAVNLSYKMFFTNHLKHKTVDRTTCRMPSANPYHL